MFAIVSLLVTLTLSLLVVRVASMALMLTGLSSEVARFQARSAFTGVGFTTSESESILDHPVRRRIIHLLMLLGNLGIAAVAGALMASLVDVKRTEAWLPTLSLLFVGLVVLWYASTSRWLERRLNRGISWALRRFSHLEIRDYVAVLNLQSGYAVTELLVESKDWLAGKSLIEQNLPKEGVLILGVQQHQGPYIGAPTASTEISTGDVLVLYGPIERLEELDQRKAGKRGEVAHEQAVTEHKDVLEEQEESLATDDEAD